MKQVYRISLSFIFLLPLLFAGCSNDPHYERLSYIEKQSSFFHLKHGNWITSKWVKTPENMMMLHETFKRFGYKRLIDPYYLNSNPFLFHDLYIKRTGQNLLDSLIITYSQQHIRTKYYREFWLRRKAEHNAPNVYLILKEISASLKSDPVPNRSKLVNDTLLSLLNIDKHERTERVTEQSALKDFNTLKRFGMHESAYFLLYENGKYEHVDINRDSLVKTLTVSKKHIFPWLDDNTP